jgi:hypothetical protein
VSRKVGSVAAGKEDTTKMSHTNNENIIVRIAMAKAESFRATAGNSKSAER